MGQMTSEEKHALSHRGKAARAMAEYLEGEGW
jgi:inosine/xanthosine triphosphate pyrophosphatase family protein